MDSYEQCDQLPFVVNNDINVNEMTCQGILPFTLHDITNTFGANLENKWKISTYFSKDMYIIYNSLIQIVFLYSNNDTMRDDLLDLADYIDAHIEEDTTLIDFSDIESENDFDNDNSDDIIRPNVNVKDFTNYGFYIR